MLIILGLVLVVAGVVLNVCRAGSICRWVDCREIFVYSGEEMRLFYFPAGDIGTRLVSVVLSIVLYLVGRWRK